MTALARSAARIEVGEKGKERKRMSERCPVCGQTDRAMFGALYIKLISAAQTNNQTVGEKNDLYVTLEQAHGAMQQIMREEALRP